MSTQGADRARLILAIAAFIFACLVGGSALLFGLAHFLKG